MSDRLISADKLKAHYAWWKGGTRELTMDEAKHDFDTIIDLQPTVPLDWKSILDDWTEHDNAMIAKGRELEQRLNAPKHGRWITVSDGYGNGVATASICECSLCKDTIWVYKNDKRKWKFCPNCGAKMDEVDNG